MVRKILLAASVIAALFAALIFSGRLPIGGSSQQAPEGTVVMWGVFPDSEMASIIQPFNAQAKTYNISYAYVPPNVFENRLVEALASGQGPDVILAPYQIILSQSSRLYPFPVDSFTEKMYKDAYLDGASVFWTPYGALALPVAIEPMVLFFNRTLLSKHGISAPPAYWDEVTKNSPALTIETTSGGFLESGIALGTETVPYIKDIIMAMIGQLGQVPVLPTYQSDGAIMYDVLVNDPVVLGGDVLPLTSTMRFIMQFSDPLKSTYTWSQFAGNATDQFVAERLAMYIGYAGELPVLRARNPRMDIDMTYLPQMKGYNTFSTGMRLYGIATIRQTKNPSASLSVQAQLGGAAWSPLIAPLVGASPALRGYVNTPGLPEVIKNSLLVTRGWYDIKAQSTDALVGVMISDILSGKEGLVDAVGSFVARFIDLYNRR